MHPTNDTQVLIICYYAEEAVHGVADPDDSPGAHSLKFWDPVGDDHEQLSTEEVVVPNDVAHRLLETYGYNHQKTGVEPYADGYAAADAINASRIDENNSAVVAIVEAIRKLGHKTDGFEADECRVQLTPYLSIDMNLQQTTPQTIMVCDKCGGHYLVPGLDDENAGYAEPCDITNGCTGTVRLAPEYDPDSPNHHNN